MTPIWILIGCAALVATLGAVEAIWLRRNQRRIGIRIHVNGTRGKSRVTRLIAAGLRAGGMRTVAKTTGTLPRLILPDGSELPIERNGRANVIEQRGVAHAAAAAGAEALVVECMALQPQLQSLCESKLVRATHGVITNCRADHLEVMGPTERDVACALANITPVGGKLFTAERRHLNVLHDAADDRRSELIHVTPEEISNVTDLEMAGFRFDEHKENVALALRVCQDLSVDRATALAGMQSSDPDPGATTTHVIEFFGRQITFVNAFAANDPESTCATWRRAIDACPSVEKRIAIVNCRSDRPHRSLQLARAMVDWPPADHIVLAGSGATVFARAAVVAGLSPQHLVMAEHGEIAGLFELILDLAGSSAVVVGMGNIGDRGLEIARYFRNRSNVAQSGRGLTHEVLQQAVADRIVSLLEERSQLPGDILDHNGKSPRGESASHSSNGHIVKIHSGMKANGAKINGTKVNGKKINGAQIIHVGNAENTLHRIQEGESL